MAKKSNKRKKSLCDECDSKWSLLVKMRAGFRCERCGKDKRLNSHHIFTRNNYITRFDLDNGICLCSGCHTMSSIFSAHKTPLEFAERIIELRGQTRYDNLKYKSHQIRDKNYDKVIEYLSLQEIKIKGDLTLKQNGLKRN